MSPRRAGVVAALQGVVSEISGHMFPSWWRRLLRGDPQQGTLVAGTSDKLGEEGKRRMRKYWEQSCQIRQSQAGVGKKEERVKGRSFGRAVMFCAYLTCSFPDHLKVLQVFFSSVFYIRAWSREKTKCFSDRELQRAPRGGWFWKPDVKTKLLSLYKGQHLGERIWFWCFVHCLGSFIFKKESNWCV